MQTQFQYITDLAKQYQTYSEQPEFLFTAINNLSKNVVEEIYKEYGDPDRDFKPVNLLRAEIARRLLLGESATKALVDEIKEKIRAKNTLFFSHYKDAFLKQLAEAEYESFKRDLFANWQNPWSVFHVFFYRSIVKETTQNYLEQITRDLLNQLDLKDYTCHQVDFQGANNFGSDWAWVALYPITKYSHKDSYQFFVRLSATPEAGRVAGHSLKEPKQNQLKRVGSYIEVISYFQELKPEIIKLNKESRNYFKFAPGSQASEWNRFHSEGIAAINCSLNPGDVSNYKSKEEINEAVGLAADNQSNQTWNLWLFRSANIGDVVFVSKGVNVCLGIGIIESDYYYDENADGFNHRRKIKWLTDKIYQYKADTLKTYKTLFRPDTFSPTKVWAFLLSEYARIYPELVPIFVENDLLIVEDESEISETVDKNTEFKGPKFLRFINPLLKALNKAGCEGKPSDITKIVANEFNFTKQELEEKSKTGVPIIYNQVAWARNYLKEAEYISNEKRGENQTGSMEEKLSAQV